MLDGGGPPGRGPGPGIEMIEGQRRLAHPVEELLRGEARLAGPNAGLETVIEGAIPEPHRDDQLEGGLLRGFRPCRAVISQDPSPRLSHVGLAQAGAIARFQPHPEHRHHVRVADVLHGLEGPVLPRPFAPADVDEHLDRDAHSPRGVGLPDLAEPSPAEELHEPVTGEDRIPDGIGEGDGARRAVDC